MMLKILWPLILTLPNSMTTVEDYIGGSVHIRCFCLHEETSAG